MVSLSESTGVNAIIAPFSSLINACPTAMQLESDLGGSAQLFVGSSDRVSFLIKNSLYDSPQHIADVLSPHRKAIK